MEPNIFTPNQQKVIAEAIKNYFDLNDMDGNSPRECAKDMINELFRDFAEAVDCAHKQSDNYESPDMVDRAFVIKTATDFVGCFDDDILHAAGVRERHLRLSKDYAFLQNMRAIEASHRALESRVTANAQSPKAV